MVGAKVSIVTHKVQTTRTRIRGIAIEGAAQLVFVDTPGLFRPRRRLDRAMVAAAWGGAADADVVVLMIEAHRGLTEGVRTIVDGARRPAAGGDAGGARDQQDRPGAGGAPAGADGGGERATGLRRDLHDLGRARLRGRGPAGRWLAARVPAGPWLYPEDQIADLPLRLIAAEITREKLTLRLHQELPYELTVETEALGGAQGRLGPHRPGRLRRRATATRASRSGRRARRSRRSARPRAPISRRSSGVRSTCS